MLVLPHPASETNSHQLHASILGGGVEEDSGSSAGGAGDKPQGHSTDILGRKEGKLPGAVPWFWAVQQAVQLCLL